MNSSSKNINHFNNLLFVYAITTVFVTVGFFLFGFFPLTSLKNNDKLASMNDLPKSINKTLYVYFISLYPINFFFLQSLILINQFFSIYFFRLNSNILYKPLVKKIVIMVIDSLRWDFISSKSDGIHNTMIFTNRLLEKNFGRLFQVKVDNPTVTMPKIKVRFHKSLSLIK